MVIHRDTQTQNVERVSPGPRCLPRPAPVLGTVSFELGYGRGEERGTPNVGNEKCAQPEDTLAAAGGRLLPLAGTRGLWP